jgi:hypothetical protein
MVKTTCYNIIEIDIFKIHISVFIFYIFFIVYFFFFNGFSKYELQNMKFIEI